MPTAISDTFSILKRGQSVFVSERKSKKKEHEGSALLVHMWRAIDLAQVKVIM